MIPFALQAHRQFKIPLVLNLYGTYAIKTLSGSLASVYKRAYQAADVIIVPSEHTAQQLSSVFPEVQSKIEILPLASSFETATNILPFDKRQRSAVFVGEIKKRKGVFELLQATKLAIDQDQLDALYVVGNICDENYYTQLLTYVEKEHLSSNITFCGKVSDDELSKLYSKSRASVLPSISDGAAFEGLGLVHLESFAYGTPSIGSRNSGSECAISDGKNGLLVSQGDVSKLAASLASLLNDESRWTKFSQNALAKTNSWQNVLNSYKALYDSLEIS